MTHEIAAYGYLIAAICFIMALRGLSSPVTSRAGNLYGIIGMVIAIGVTVASPGVVAPWLIIGGLVIGGAIGAVVAMRIQMTALPQLVAAFHSLVGLAAVFVAAAAFVSPEAFGLGLPGKIKMHSRIEMGLGTVIGAITFTGSIVAFAKLQGLVSGSPLVFRGQHPLNALLGIMLVVLLVWFALRGHPVTFILLIVLSLLIGFLLILPIGGADMP
ncbi:MAG TPA: NAD(P)(+) transhydrogenase (Re/Si-specific) subunit beta, partial [Dongiaceae bacterium]|nr:NAD(P)(+) transhydrogenase (Re/Si-specific) subunit beta [Dongiaceae bacterium]